MFVLDLIIVFFLSNGSETDQGFCFGKIQIIRTELIVSWISSFGDKFAQTEYNHIHSIPSAIGAKLLLSDVWRLSYFIRRREEENDGKVHHQKLNFCN